MDGVFFLAVGTVYEFSGPVIFLIFRCLGVSQDVRMDQDATEVLVPSGWSVVNVWFYGKKWR